MQKLSQNLEKECSEEKKSAYARGARGAWDGGTVTCRGVRLIRWLCELAFVLYHVP